MTVHRPLSLHVPQPADFAGMAELQAGAFTEATEQQHFQTYQRYQRECPHKLQHCRIIKSPTDDSVVLAACQLMIHPPKQQHTNESKTKSTTSTSTHGAVFVEWIACLPTHRGQGLGSQLLDWAAQHAQWTLQVDRLSLYVVQSNTSARRLYERHGFVQLDAKGRALNPSRAQKWWSHAVARSPLGHLSVHHMQKELVNLDTETATDMSSSDVVVPKSPASWRMVEATC